MKFIAYGLNHTTAPVQVREKYALAPVQIKDLLKVLRSQAPEAVFLSTCNRVEFYMVTEKPKESQEAVRKALGKYHRLKPDEVKKYFYFFEGPDAFRHLFRVAGSLDSMVLGEAQILGQVKEAFQHARETGMAGTLMNGIFSRAFSAAKKVRSQTGIARMPVSIPSVAVELAGRIFSPLSERKVLLLGAGEMGELTAKYLADAGVKEVFIANRTPEKAKTLAGKLGGRALSMTEGHKELRKMDIVLTSVSGGDFLLTGPVLGDVMKERNGKPLFIIDMGVPRNVDPEAGKVEAIYLYNIDDLSQAAETNREARRGLVESAETILKEDIEKLCSWLNTLELVPTIVRLREKFEGLRKMELEEFLKKHPGLPEKEVKAVERLTHDLTAKLLHDPSVTLKNVKTAADRFEFARMLNEIFALMGKNDE